MVGRHFVKEMDLKLLLQCTAIGHVYYQVFVLSPKTKTNKTKKQSCRSSFSVLNEWSVSKCTLVYLFIQYFTTTLYILCLCSIIKR